MKPDEIHQFLIEKDLLLIKEGNQVRIIEGEFAGQIGEVLRMDKKDIPSDPDKMEWVVVIGKRGEIKSQKIVPLSAVEKI